MTRDDFGWNWFDPLCDAASDAAAVEPANLELPRLVARCFSSPDGRRVLQHLRALTLERSLGPSASDAMLRHLEGQRSLVVYLITLTTRGSGGGGAQRAPAAIASHPEREPDDV